MIGPPPPPPKSERPRARRIVVVVIGVSLVVLTGACVVFASVGGMRLGWPLMQTRRPATFAVDGSTMALVQVEEGSETLATVDLDSGERTVLAAELPGHARSIAIDGEWVLWGSCHDAGGIPCVGETFATRQGGGAPVSVLGQVASEIVTGGGNAYVRAGEGVFAGPLGAPLGPHPWALDASRTSGAFAIASNRDWLFILSQKDVQAWDHAGRSRRVLGSGCKTGGLLAAAGDAVFVACSREGPGGSDRIIRLPIDGALQETWGALHEVAAMSATERGLVVVWTEPDPGDPSSGSSMLGVIPRAAAPVRIVIERSGWGPIAVREGQVLLLDYHYVFRAALP